MLPVLYLVLLLLYGVLFVMGAGGHGKNPFDFVVYVAMPTCLLLDLLPPSWGPQSGALSFLLCAALGLIQWVIIGYVVDRILFMWRNRKQIT
ncbi:MAG TPA: hypothetical protein VE961_05020 [Pyrinomonadaceae bacterium]|nr:hypothetical protein [Pyrinomonadaceae bacterium]